MVWDYRLQARDLIRLSPVNLTTDVVSARVRQLFGVEATALPVGVTPIFDEENHNVLWVLLPAFTACRVEGFEHEEPHHGWAFFIITCSSLYHFFLLLKCYMGTSHIFV